MEIPSFQPILSTELIQRTLYSRTSSHAASNQVFTQVTTDSRQVTPGCLFVALSGEKYDGHDFISVAVERGARGILCRKGHPIVGTKEVSIFFVEDTLKAFRKLAAAWRKEFLIPMVVVAGSAGKTTTKELLAAILRGKWSSVLKTQGSQNGYVGIPMTLLELRAHHQAAVIEVGIDEVGAMQSHMNLVGAEYVILTAIGPEHLEKLQDVPTVAREEGLAILHVIKNQGTALINLDDPWIRPFGVTPNEGNKILYSLGGQQGPSPEVSAFLERHSSASFSGGRSTIPGNFLLGTLIESGKKLQISGMGREELSLPLPLMGSHNASNLLGAVAAAVALGLTPQEIQAGLKTFTGLEGRSQLKELSSGVSVLCDYYNAQPASVVAGLQLLKQLSLESSRKGATWACLGDMLELGPNEELFHRELAAPLMDLQVEHVLLYGPRMKALADELHRLKFSGHLSYHESHAELAREVIQKVRAGDVVLIKGSRGMKMETLWKALQESCESKWSKIGES
ncbi:MAG: UDP-N-acetylmuramoyl-tripeptide--D-alanyl-D-alanine ligase [Bdellovibrionia bacterium]